jgi:hypothetical protein
MGLPDNRATDKTAPDVPATDTRPTSDRTTPSVSRDLAGHRADRFGHAEEPGARATAVTPASRRSTADRRGDRDTEELLRIAREAVRAEDKLTRRVVADAIRGQRIPLSNDTLTALMIRLREQHGQDKPPVTTAPS